jgi:Flp pilus assembly pilin Flp
MNSLQSRRRGAISTEYIIILVLIAVGGVIAFMLLGTTLRQQAANSIDKVGGKSSTYTESDRVDDSTARMKDDVVDMSQTEEGGAEEDITIEEAGG